MSDNVSNSREMILEAAIKLFSDKGFNGTTINEIAKEAGLSQGMIYYIFESKDQLLVEILDSFKKELTRVFTAIYSKDEYSPYHGLWESGEIKEGMEFFIKNRQLWIVLFSESLKSETGKENLIGIWDSLNKSIRQQLLNDRGFSIEQGDLTRDLVDLFFVFMPAVLFSIFVEDWRKMRGYSEDDAHQGFASVLNGVYSQFLKNTGPNP